MFTVLLKEPSSSIVSDLFFWLLVLLHCFLHGGRGFVFARTRCWLNSTLVGRVFVGLFLISFGFGIILALLFNFIFGVGVLFLVVGVISDRLSLALLSWRGS